MQRGIIPRAFLFLQRHKYVCSAEKAYGLQIFILFTLWGYCCIQSKLKSLGILLIFFLIPFTVCEALRMFLWTNRAVFSERSQMHQRCQSLRVPQPWENNIYGNGKSIKHLSYCSPCSVVFMFKNDFVSSGWKYVKNIFLFSFLEKL